MAYQAGASLGQFWDAMLKLRSQRLEEQQTNAALAQRRNEGWQSMGMDIGGRFATGINNAIGKGGGGGENAMYNQATAAQGFGGVAPPRAGGVEGQPQWSDAEMQRPTSAGEVKFATGGKEEFMMNQAIIQKTNADLAAKQLTRVRDQQIAANTMRASSAPMQSAFKDITAYQKNAAVHMDGIGEAIEGGNKPVYDQGVQALTTTYDAFKLAHPNANVPPPIIPPFVKQAEMKAISDAQQGITAEQMQVKQMQAQPEKPWISPNMIPNWVPKGDTLRTFGTNQPGIDALKQSILSKQEELKNLPGASEYFKSQQGGGGATMGAATGNKPGQVVGGWELGKKKVNPQTGQTVIWNGKEWEMQ